MSPLVIIVGLEKPKLEPKPEIIIKEMPSQKLLEDFLAGMSGPVRVIFNRELGKFERLVEDDQ